MGLAIDRTDMARWTIQCVERYLSIIYDYLHQEMYHYHVVQADETPVRVTKENRTEGMKHYMWVYRTGKMYQDKQIILYDYQPTRNAGHPRDFLKAFAGVCVTDGYQVYYTIEKEREDLRIAGCWAHARRRFDEAVKALTKAARNISLAYLALKQIQAIYREDSKLSAVNSEEQTIRPFCVEKKNWVMIDTIVGAEASAIIYSIAETAKANNLKPYNYFEYLLEEIPKHMDDRDTSFCKDLLTWSDKLPAECRK